MLIICIEYPHVYIQQYRELAARAARAALCSPNARARMSGLSIAFAIPDGVPGNAAKRYGGR